MAIAARITCLKEVLLFDPGPLPDVLFIVVDESFRVVFIVFVFLARR
jgi:hypothetical protein